MYGDFGQALASYQMQRDQMRNQANIAAMKYGNKGGGGGSDDYAKMYKLGLETAELREQLAQLQEARNKEAKNKQMSLLSELAIAKKNNDVNRMNFIWSQLMQNEDFAKGVKQAAGPVIENGVPYIPGDPKVNIEVSTKAFNYFNQLGYIKTNAQAKADAEHEAQLKSMEPAQEEDPYAVKPSDSGPTIFGSTNTSDSTKNQLKRITLPKSEKIKSKSSSIKGEVNMQHPSDPTEEDLNRQYAQQGGETEAEEEAWRNSEEYRQLVDAEKEATGQFKPGERPILEDDFLHAIETGDFTKIPPEYHDEMKAWLSGVKVCGNQDGTYTIYSQLDVTNMLTQQQQQQLAAEQRSVDYLDGLFNSSIGQQARIEEQARKNTMDAQQLQSSITAKQQALVNNAKSPRDLANITGSSYNMDTKTGLNTQSHEPAYPPVTTGGNSSKDPDAKYPDHNTAFLNAWNRLHPDKIANSMEEIESIATDEEIEEVYNQKGEDDRTLRDFYSQDKFRDKPVKDALESSAGTLDLIEALATNPSQPTFNALISKANGVLPAELVSRLQDQDPKRRQAILNLLSNALYKDAKSGYIHKKQASHVLNAVTKGDVDINDLHLLSAYLKREAAKFTELGKDRNSKDGNSARLRAKRYTEIANKYDAITGVYSTLQQGTARNVLKAVEKVNVNKNGKPTYTIKGKTYTQYSTKPDTAMFGNNGDITVLDDQGNKYSLLELTGANK